MKYSNRALLMPITSAAADNDIGILSTITHTNIRDSYSSLITLKYGNFDELVNWKDHGEYKAGWYENGVFIFESNYTDVFCIIDNAKIYCSSDGILRCIIGDVTKKYHRGNIIYCGSHYFHYAKNRPVTVKLFDIDVPPSAVTAVADGVLIHEEYFIPWKLFTFGYL